MHLVALIHLVFLCFWGGTVATEAVLEFYPRRRPEAHEFTVRAHYWIDLLVELPLIAGVVITGATLVALSWPLSNAHILKISLGLAAVTSNLICVVLVIRRRESLLAGDGLGAQRASRQIVISAVVGLPFAVAAAALGFWLAQQRLSALMH